MVELRQQHKEKQTVLVVLGTRPEAIKLARVITELQKNSELNIIVCSTDQHEQLLDQALAIFNTTIDIHMHVMTRNQKLDALDAKLMRMLGWVLEQLHPSVVVVQGDTTTAMVAAVAAFYRNIT